MITIDDFKSTVNKQGGLSRNNLFEVEIDLPSAVSQSSNPNRAQQLTNVLAKAVSLPSSTMSTLEYYYNGKAYKVPGDRQFEPWTCTFFVDQNFETKNAIIDWIESNRASCPEYHLDPAIEKSKVNHVKNMFIHVLNRQQQRVHSVKMYSAYPTTIQGGNLDYGDNDSVMEITCQFDYQYWTVVNRNDRPPVITADKGRRSAPPNQRAQKAPRTSGNSSFSGDPLAWQKAIKY